MVSALRPWVATATKLRLGFALVAILYAALADRFIVALPWVLALVAFELAAETSEMGELNRWKFGAWHFFLAASAVTAGIAFNTVGPAVAVLAFVPAHHAGVRLGFRGYIGMTGLAAGSELLALVLTGRQWNATDGWTQFTFWVVATACIGALGAVSASVAGVPEGPDAWEQARYHLGRLGQLAEAGTAGFDAPSIASECLAEVAGVVRHERSVVLAREGDGPMRPLALHGVRRLSAVPTESGTFPSDLFDHGVRTLTYRDPERGLRVALVIPLGNVQPSPAMGVTLDRDNSDGFDPGEVRAAVAALAPLVPRLEVALLFESLRSLAVLEERQHLAHEMHDGIAQDLAALGFEIDLVRHVAKTPGAEVTDELAKVREHVTAIISDLRLRITDLSMAPRPERSLGAVIGQTLQRFGAAHGIRTTLEMDEGQLRLQPHVENAFFRLVLAVLQDARAGGAEQVTVRLSVHGTHGDLDIVHDGRSGLLAKPKKASDAIRNALPVHVEECGDQGVRVHAVAGPGAADSASMAAPSTSGVTASSALPLPGKGSRP